ncbi:MAG: tail fiber domain-containing protein [Methanobrevibacter sp.]|nr:tail fiber domain-containing protein [Methanobrevibacter sp.]
MSLVKNGSVIGGISKTLLSKIGFSDLTTNAQNLCDGVNELDDKKVNKFGDTMTGTLNFDYTTGADIEIPARNVSYIEGAAGDAGLYAKKAYNINNWYPAVCLQTKGGGSWQMGNYNNEDLLFVYATKNNIDTQTNTVNKITLPSDVTGTIYTTGNKPSASDVEALALSGGTMTGAIAFNNATTRRNTAKNLGNEAVSSPAYVIGLTSNWGTYGYTTIAQLKSTFGYGNICSYNIGASGNWFSRAAVIGSTGVMEIGAYIDFHVTSGATSDYNFRFTALSNGNLQASGSISQGSSYKIKENIEDMTLDEAEKILSLKPVKFDYIEGSKNQMGFIAEDVGEIIPNLYFEEKGDENDHKMFTPASLNYIGMIPYLVKICQNQQKKIEDLEAAIKAL